MLSTIKKHSAAFKAQVAIIDVYIAEDTEITLGVLKDNGMLEIINSDQGYQFTSSG